MTPITRLAKRLSYERVPETCPDVHTAGVRAIAKFLHFCSSKTRWFGRMNRAEQHAFEVRVGELVADCLDGAKEQGTLKLRAAYVREIEDRLRLHMSPERIARIDAGDDADVPETETLSVSGCMTHHDTPSFV
jgi:hypothetical protein